MEAAELRIEPVRARHLGDLDVLFSTGAPRWCQCAFMRLTNADWSATTSEQNRDLHHKAVRRAARAGRAAGLIAYDGTEPVGWVSFGPRSDFGRLAASRILAPVDDQAVWSVVCFVVAPRARRQGVASTLLDATIDWAAEHQVPMLEGYPVDAAGGRRPGADLWRGTLSMFEAAGFAVVTRRGQSKTSPSRPIVRRPL